jgi:hypothetical protein
VLSIRVVDLVDDQRRIRNLLLHPADILLLRLRYHNLEGVVAARRLAHAIAELGYDAEIERVALKCWPNDSGRLGVRVPS